MAKPDFKCIYGCELNSKRKPDQYTYVRTPLGTIYCVQHWRKLLG